MEGAGESQPHPRHRERREERAKQVDFSINYTVSKQVVIVRKDSSIKSVKDVNNQKIAVQLGSVADTLLTKDYPKVTLVREKKYLAAIQDLKDSKVDAVVMDELPAKEMIKNNNTLNILDGSFAEDSYGMVVKKGNKELLDVINGVLERLVKDGKIDSFIIKHTN